MDRDTLQKRAVDLLFQHYRLICQWATGVGKSNVALRFLRQNPGMVCLIIVPEQNNIENWTEEFSKFGVSMELVRVICYASLHKYKNTAWDLIVFDECPHLDTEKRKLISQSIRSRYVLALGAKIDESEEQALEDTYGKFAKSIVTLDNAIEWGILPPPQVNVLHMELDDIQYRNWHKGKTYTDYQMYQLLGQKVDAAISAYNERQNSFTRSKMFRAGNERKRFLGKLKSDAIRRVCEYLAKNNKRFLCFCSSIKQAESIGGELAFTSKTPASLKLLERFNNHEIDSLYVVGKLIEGQNLKDIDAGIIGQIGGTDRITIQQCGRIMRSTKPVIYVPVFSDTKDDSFLYTLTSNISKDYIKHYKF
jgi:superfamily II DNA or RNA helicase